jgi:hypothetical protein
MQIPCELRHLFNWIQMSVLVLLSAVLSWLVVRIYKQKLSGVTALVRLIALAACGLSSESAA